MSMFVFYSAGWSGSRNAISEGSPEGPDAASSCGHDIALCRCRTNQNQNHQWSLTIVHGFCCRLAAAASQDASPEGSPEAARPASSFRPGSAPLPLPILQLRDGDAATGNSSGQDGQPGALFVVPMMGNLKQQPPLQFVGRHGMTISSNGNLPNMKL